MPRPRRDPDAIGTSDRLLDAAAQVFAAHGFARARLEDIASAAGIRRSSLLYHFATKDALYAAVIRQRFEALELDLVPALDPAEPLHQRLESLEARFVAHVDGHPELAVLLLREVLDGQGPGRGLLLEAALPLLDAVDQALDEAGGEGAAQRPPGLRRLLLLQVAMHALVRAAAGPLRAPLWGEEPPPPTLALALLGPQRRA